MDIYENNAYDIQQELLYQYGGRLNLKVEIASIRDRRRMRQIFATYRPDVVFMPLRTNTCRLWKTALRRRSATMYLAH